MSISALLLRLCFTFLSLNPFPFGCCYLPPRQQMSGQIAAVVLQHNCDRRFLTFLAILENWNLLSLNPFQKMNEFSQNKFVFILFRF